MIVAESLPAAMKAWVWSKADQTISLAQQPLPTLNMGDVLVANKAIGLNPVDWKFIETDLGGIWPDGRIPGVDGAGVVVAVANDHLRHWLGVAVCYHQSLNCDGSYAEYTAIDARTVIRIPSQMSWTQASAFPCPVMTAWQALEKIPAQPGARIMVTGASGAVGRALVQLAKLRQFNVTAVASERRRASLHDLGADHSIATPEAAGGAFYAVFDTVSDVHAETLAPMVEANGHLVCIMGRLERTVVPPFSTAISQHEVALNALHGSGSDAQWQRFTREAEVMVKKFHRGELTPPDTWVDAFDRLDEALQAFKSHRKALKYSIELDTRGSK